MLVNMLGYGDGTRRGQGTKARTPVMKSMKFLAKEKTKGSSRGDRGEAVDTQDT